MIRGIELFRDHFQNYVDKYTIIGGTACDISLNRMGQKFRATKDIDIVLLIEALDAEFSKAFWDFIRMGGYKNQKKATGKKLFYRFDRPENKIYPYMLELFSRKPDVVIIPSHCHLVPVSITEEASSLSAILLNDDYYGFIQNGITVVDGLSIVSAEYLIPLKVKAYLELTELKKEGKHIDNKDIKKHKNDVFRLYQILSLENSISLPPQVADDMKLFLNNILTEPIDLNNIGLKNTRLDIIINDLEIIFKL
ncbi:MAG: hypothetical protein K9M57_01550 [Phycisphaerae bacterium]|nr:hypothetical protein [Phycisphaerae bacterium]